MAALRQTMASNYLNILRLQVFNNSNITGKDKVAYQRLLSGEEAQRILEALWKESKFVTSSELLDAGYSKEFSQEGLNSHKLGVRLAEDKTKVSATVSRVRSIIIAGCAYGLVSKDRTHVKNSPVQGTLLLHNLMVELGIQNSVASDCFLPSKIWPSNVTMEDASNPHRLGL